VNTLARIATVAMGNVRKPAVEAGREFVMGLLDRALLQPCDLVCLPEAFATVGVGGPLAERCEPLDGPTVAAAAKRAREHRCYVICPLKTARDGAFFNSAVILDRSGQVAGVYDKACPVNTAADYTVFEDGVTPGAATPPVFDLDFGRIGIQICFDAGFPENWQSLAEAGARLVFWPSAYDGGFPLRVYAYLHHVYVVSSTRAGEGRVIDPLGAVVAETAPHWPVIRREINLDHVTVHFDYNQDVPARIAAAYGDRVEVRCSAPGSGHFLIEPRDPAVTAAALAAEFGFESTRQYHDRHRKAFAEIHAGRTPTPQRAAHGERAKYK
jgi:beta-ureidopropionase